MILSIPSKKRKLSYYTPTKDPLERKQRLAFEFSAAEYFEKRPIDQKQDNQPHM